jgi:hypoxanthine phosphoribosyltransferase
MSNFNSNLFEQSQKTRREPFYIEDDQALDPKHFYIPQHYQAEIQHLLVPHGMIVDRVEKLAYDIAQDYEGHTIHMLCVLKGGSTFFGDLCKALRRFHDC